MRAVFRVSGALAAPAIGIWMVASGVALGQAQSKNLMPPGAEDVAVSGQGGWKKDFLGSRNSAIGSDDWIVKIKPEGTIYFESTQAMAAMITLRRDDMNGCTSVKGTISLEGNAPKVWISDGSSNSVQLASGKDQTFSLKFKEELGAVFVMLNLASGGKFSGRLHALTADGCQ